MNTEDHLSKIFEALDAAKVEFIIAGGVSKLRSPLRLLTPQSIGLEFAEHSSTCSDITLCSDLKSSEPKPVEELSFRLGVTI